jgi:hypothetical protein
MQARVAIKVARLRVAPLRAVIKVGLPRAVGPMAVKAAPLPAARPRVVLLQAAVRMVPLRVAIKVALPRAVGPVAIKVALLPAARLRVGLPRVAVRVGLPRVAPLQAVGRVVVMAVLLQAAAVAAIADRRIAFLLCVGMVFMTGNACAGPDFLPNDPRRPVDKISRDLGIEPQQFVACFNNVRPAPGGTRPTSERTHANKAILLGCLQKANPAITNDRLDAVMDTYRPGGHEAQEPDDEAQ